MNDQTLRITLENGVTISGFKSEEQAGLMLMKLMGASAKQVHREEKKEQPKTEKKKYKSRKGKTHVRWTEEENLFVTSNLEKGGAWLCKSFLASKHTKSAIYNKLYLETDKKKARMAEEEKIKEQTRTPWHQK